MHALIDSNGTTVETVNLIEALGDNTVRVSRYDSIEEKWYEDVVPAVMVVPVKST